MRTGMSRWLEDEWNLMKSTLNSSLPRLSAPELAEQFRGALTADTQQSNLQEGEAMGRAERGSPRAGPTARGRGRAWSAGAGVLTMLRGRGAGVKRRLNRDIQTRTRPTDPAPTSGEGRGASRRAACTCQAGGVDLASVEEGRRSEKKNEQKNRQEAKTEDGRRHTTASRTGSYLLPHCSLAIPHCCDALASLPRTCNTRS